MTKSMEARSPEEYTQCHFCEAWVYPLSVIWRVVTNWATMKKMQVAECEGCYEARNGS